MTQQSNANRPKSNATIEKLVAKPLRPLPSPPRAARYNDCRVWEPPSEDDRSPFTPSGHHPCSDPNENRFSVLAEIDSRGERASWAFDFIPPPKRYVRRRGKRGGRGSKTKTKQPLRPGIFNEFFKSLKSPDNPSAASDVSNGSQGKANDKPYSEDSTALDKPLNGPEYIRSTQPDPSATKPPPDRIVFGRQTSQKTPSPLSTLSFGRRTPPLHAPFLKSAFSPQTILTLPATSGSNTPSPGLSQLLRSNFSRHASISTFSATSQRSDDILPQSPQECLLQESAKRAQQQITDNTRRDSRFFPRRAAAAAALRALSLTPPLPTPRSRSPLITSPLAITSPLIFSPSLTPSICQASTSPPILTPSCYNLSSPSSSTALTPSLTSSTTNPGNWQECGFGCTSGCPLLSATPQTPQKPTAASVPSNPTDQVVVQRSPNPALIPQPEEEPATIPHFLNMGHATPCWCRPTPTPSSPSQSNLLPTPSQLLLSHLSTTTVPETPLPPLREPLAFRTATLSSSSSEILPTPSQLLLAHLSTPPSDLPTSNQIWSPPLLASRTFPTPPQLLPRQSPTASETPDSDPDAEFEHIAAEASDLDSDGWTVVRGEARVGRAAVSAREGRRRWVRRAGVGRGSGTGRVGRFAAPLGVIAREDEAGVEVEMQEWREVDAVVAGGEWVGFEDEDEGVGDDGVREGEERGCEACEACEACGQCEARERGSCEWEWPSLQEAVRVARKEKIV